ncbi:hypothetical protein IX317_000615 [Fusobacterium sp. DD29]|uniref:hypothetical protein n=1 Tax=unclassified Fusobacterium TaxID=2648384 RepID=UPI001B8D6865|nr:MULTISPECIES: hypothetical protein [unclassified Fusobacterium]MBR8700263.1 hypothetical protein [Fusobacterium sp. DD45]MBR8710482.1 hypothetical protein [Fusobacterium sp. DD28]MBR8748954.1 hypothetical protein [Fusobacterium sp. DD29]MBR8751068.1 hypothetical protein [Fusobacterium sp. DD26]MBR8761260.1 hypothetical protein [Fusobacterium sp. DD25]
MKIWQLIILIMIILRIFFICICFKDINKQNYKGMTMYLKYYKKTTGKINAFYLIIFLIEIAVIAAVAEMINDLFEKMFWFMDEKIRKLTDKTYRLIFSKFEPEEGDQ